MTRSRTALLLTTLMMVVGVTIPADAQERQWLADVTVGDTGFVDETTDHLFTIGGSIRRLITPRVSVGPEFVAMIGEGTGDAPDRAVLLTANVVFDAYPLDGRTGRRVTPFLVGGVGLFRSRSPLATGPYWAGDPAFTAGGGIRARLTDRVSAAAEYRIGWELHQRFTGGVTVALR